MILNALWLWQKNSPNLLDKISGKLENVSLLVKWLKPMHDISWTPSKMNLLVALDGVVIKHSPFVGVSQPLLLWAVLVKKSLSPWRPTWQWPVPWGWDHSSTTPISPWSLHDESNLKRRIPFLMDVTSVLLPIPTTYQQGTEGVSVSVSEGGSSRRILQHFTTRKRKQDFDIWTDSLPSALFFFSCTVLNAKFLLNL